MLLLALDTSTSSVAVAVHDGERVRAAATHTPEAGRPRHVEVLAPAVAGAFLEAGAAVEDLTHLAVGVGPGPFTGLRVGLVTAEVLGLVRRIPVLGLCSHDGFAHDAVAAGALGDEDLGVAVVTDAGRREVYAARFDREGRRTGGPVVVSPADLAAGLGPLVAVGPGALRYADVLTDAGVRVAGPAAPSAEGLATVVAGLLLAGAPLPATGFFAVGDPDSDGSGIHVPVGLLPPAPLYLRRPDAVPAPGIAQASP